MARTRPSRLLPPHGRRMAHARLRACSCSRRAAAGRGRATALACNANARRGITRDRIGDPRFWYQGFFARIFSDFLEIFRVIFWIFLASPGPGVAGNGFSAKNHSQFRGRDANPCPEDPFRGDFPFLEPKKTWYQGFWCFYSLGAAQGTKHQKPWFGSLVLC